jgi:uncharacterized protein (TIGR00290 family)
MNKPTKIVMAWSGGKDSSLALHSLRENPDYQITALLTTITKDYDRISMHGVRTSLREQQAAVLELPLEKVLITTGASDAEYREKMREKLLFLQNQGVEAVGFGDIFLEDLKIWRENNLAEIGMRGVFPLWKIETRKLADNFVKLGFKGIITCVDTQVLNGKFAGRLMDESFFADLPPQVDPCGENGEFHSFVFDGPIFKQAIPCQTGEKLLRDNRFYYCDLISH